MLVLLLALLPVVPLLCPMLRAYCSPSLLDLRSKSCASPDGDELHQRDFIMGKESSVGNLGLESTTRL